VGGDGGPVIGFVEKLHEERVVAAAFHAEEWSAEGGGLSGGVAQCGAGGAERLEGRAGVIGEEEPGGGGFAGEG
jgi:hypothetical protein